MEDGVPTEAEIEWAVKGLQNNRARGSSRMWAEDLKGWLAAARQGEREIETVTKDKGGEKGECRTDEKAGEENWARVVELVQTAFRDGGL